MNVSGIDGLGLERVLKRGSGTVVEERDAAILVHDAVSGAFMLACEDADEGRALLRRHIKADCRLLLVTDYALGLEAFREYGFTEKLECYQAAYFGGKPAPEADLAVRTAGEGDLPLLLAHYDKLSEEELAEVVRSGSVLLGYADGRPVGFVGEHLEGSIGLLYVFPEFRRRGFAAALQRSMIAKTMDAGFVPFGQVERSNSASLALQKKLGMTLSKRLIVWMWK